jgi:hypothetical protein
VIALRGTTFTTAPTPAIAKVLSARAKLLVSECTFKDGTLAELFQALSHHVGQSLTLDCRNIKPMSNEWANSLGAQPTLEISTLTELIWDGNRIHSWNVNQFMNFLRNQPALQSLSISDCFYHDDSTVVAHLEGYFRNARCRLTSFTIRANTPQTTIGRTLVGSIKTLFRQQSLRSLDITGQNMGHDELRDIIKGMPLAIENFWFDRNGISSPDGLFGVVDALLEHQKQWVFLSWPELDAKAVQHQVRSNHKSDIDSRIGRCRERFAHACRGKQQDEHSNSIITGIKRYAEFAEDGWKKAVATPSQKVVAVGLEEGNFDSAPFRVPDDEVIELLAKCSITPKVDPLAAVFGKVEPLITIEHLLNEQDG